MVEKEAAELSKKNKIDSNQFYNLITGEEVSWQAIIYDLIKTEQLDPWDIDVGVLAEKYSQVIQQLEEANFYVSSKVLYACSLLLRLKSEILSNKFLQELDEAIYGIQENKKYLLEKIQLDEDEIPILVPKTPMPRYKKVTLLELMSALHKAIETENRRIRKDIRSRQAEKLTSTVLPKTNRVPLSDRISLIFEKIGLHFKQPAKGHMTFSELAPSKEEKLSCFLPVLHLSNNSQVFLHQPKHFEEIFLHLKQLEEEISLLKKELGEQDGSDNTEDIEEEISELEEFEEGMAKAISDKNLRELEKDLEFSKIDN